MENGPKSKLFRPLDKTFL